MPRIRKISTLWCVEWECGCVYREGVAGGESGFQKRCKKHTPCDREQETLYIIERSQTLLEAYHSKDV